MTRLEKLHRLKRKIEAEIHRIENTSASCDEIVKYACEWFNLGHYKLISDSRKKNHVKIRCIITHELRNRGYTYYKIGDSINRNHSAIIYLEGRYKDFFEFDDLFNKHARAFADHLNEWEDELREAKMKEKMAKEFGIIELRKRKTFI